MLALLYRSYLYYGADDSLSCLWFYRQGWLLQCEETILKQAGLQEVVFMSSCIQLHWSYYGTHNFY
jgi:hypothetical protein